LITKDALTSVERCFKKSNDHSRSQSIRLSGASQTLYENEFPKHLNYIQRIFEFYTGVRLIWKPCYCNFAERPSGHGANVSVYWWTDMLAVLIWFTYRLKPKSCWKSPFCEKSFFHQNHWPLKANWLPEKMGLNGPKNIIT